MPSKRSISGLIFAFLVTGCSQAAKPVRPAVPEAPFRTGQTFTVLPVADYSYVSDVESAFRRQVAAQAILSAILEYYGFQCTPQQDVDRYLIEAGFLKPMSFEADIEPAADTASLENLLNEAWSGMMKNEIVGLIKNEKRRSIPGLANQDSHLPRPETGTLDSQAIINIGREFGSDYILRARLLEYDLRQEYGADPLRRNTLSFLGGENQTLRQFSVAQASRYDNLDNLFIGGELMDLGPQNGHSLRLQLWVQDTDSGEVVWTKQTYYPIAKENFIEAEAEATDILLTYFLTQVAVDSDGDGVWDHKDNCAGTPAGVPVDRFGCPADEDEDGVFDYLDKCPNTPPAVPVDEAGCPLDSDGDGVADHLDDCPETQDGMEVDGLGCPKDSDGDGIPDKLDRCPQTPAGAAVDKDGCPADSDGDGIADGMDECPRTPPGIEVDAMGCPPDSDNDGIADHLDRCPDTPAGIAVDPQGCPEPMAEEVVSMELRVEFDFDEAEIKPAYYGELEKMANFLKAYPETTAVIEGHTDSAGSEEYNVKLSQTRAENVKTYLVEKFGIAASRLQAKGHGEAIPIAENTSPLGRQKNRRSVAVISAGITK